MSDLPPYAPGLLPPGVRSRFVEDVNGLRMHVLEAGIDAGERPCVLLLHGFPELAYTWRKVMLPLAHAGFHVIAPDQRGYGRTTGCDTTFDGDLRAFRMLNLVKDAVALVHAFGYASVHALVGHDFGSVVAAWAGIVAQAVAPHMPTPAQVAACEWLPDNELAVYVAEFGRTGFQGGLQWYRCETSGINGSEFQVFAGRTIDVPSCFIAGRQDWGYRQRPGAFEAMQEAACTRLVGCDLVEGAGHWVQQERPEEVTRLLLRFLR